MPLSLDTTTGDEICRVLWRLPGGVVSARCPGDRLLRGGGELTTMLPLPILTGPMRDCGSLRSLRYLCREALFVEREFEYTDVPSARLVDTTLNEPPRLAGSAGRVRGRSLTGWLGWTLLRPGLASSLFLTTMPRSPLLPAGTMDTRLETAGSVLAAKRPGLRSS